MVYVMILMMVGGQPVAGSVATAEFADKEACNSAGFEAQRALDNWPGYRKLSWVCAPKATEKPAKG